MGRQKLQDDAADNIDNIDILPEDSDSIVAEDNTQDDEDVIPDMSDPKWNEYVLLQFEDDELLDGNPTVDGLRRVVHKVLGPIYASVPIREVAPNIHNNYHAMVAWEIQIRFTSDDSIRTFGDVADVCDINTHPDYAMYASATAATRAEGRALRKALQLKRVIAAEEAGSITAGVSNGKINTQQINFIDMMCGRLDINVMKLLNMSKKFKVDKIEDVSHGSAVQINKFLSECQNGKQASGEPRNIPPEIIGYEPNWRK